jgi:hypothetical protein
MKLKAVKSAINKKPYRIAENLRIPLSSKTSQSIASERVVFIKNRNAIFSKNAEKSIFGSGNVL